ncbi:MAG: hybrid sensor histidine kinase/response regulator [Bdellovibrionales bacterium]|nr:hybrid sensor histidine kinase/response regulator [Bdellovibrionales bacterium]
MKNSPLRILLIDDDEDDFVHIRDLLGEVQTTHYTIFWESSYEGGLKAIRELSFDACLLDYKLGEKSGLELLIEAKKRSFTYPIILLTGLGDFELDVKAMESGASDYLVKDQLTGPLLERSVRYSIKQAHDMEELKQIRAQVIQQERLASLGLLASSLAHEIGTPLGIIRSRAELAQKRAPDNPTLQDNVLVTITQIDRITKLVNSLLHLARGGKSDHTTSVELDHVIEDVLNLLEHEFGRKGIHLKKEILAGCRLKAEAGPLGQVLLNLLVNSIHAIEDSRKITTDRNYQVTLKVEDLGSQIQISIIDNGTGISEDNQTQLFKPFFTTKEIGFGTGLGLATSFRLVSSWGGTISVNSHLGEGSAFVVRIPK